MKFIIFILFIGITSVISMDRINVYFEACEEPCNSCLYIRRQETGSMLTVLGWEGMTSVDWCERACEKYNC